MLKKRAATIAATFKRHHEIATDGAELADLLVDSSEHRLESRSRSLAARDPGVDGAETIGDLVEREAECLKGFREADPLDRGVGVLPVSRRASLGNREHAPTLIESHRIDGDSGPPRDLPDFQVIRHANEDVLTLEPGQGSTLSGLGPEEGVMTQSTRRIRSSGTLKWGLGGLGAAGVGLATCSLACSIGIPLLLVLGLGTAAASAIEAGAEIMGAILVAGGAIAIMFAGVRRWRQRLIACALDGKGMRHRLDEFREAFGRGYLSGERTAGGVRWRFRAVPGLERDLRSLAEREHACCRFFRFDVRASGSEIWWDTSVDDAEAQPILDAFFTLPTLLTSRRERRGRG